MQNRTKRWQVGLVIGLLLILSVVVPPGRAAAEDARCFHETAQCVSGRFEGYWEQNGGLPVFGFPVTPTMPYSSLSRRAVFNQVFERNRFELHPENAAPYDVLLGRLGDDELRSRGIDWHVFPAANGPQAGCLWFAQTRHNVCNQQGALGFRSYWESHGLADPRLDTYGQSLALFGLPLSEPRMETNASGDRVLTQWFERARFEWHPDLAAPYNVLLGPLGRELTGPTPHPPVELRIPSIGLDMAPVAVGLDLQGFPIVPMHDVGWYSQSSLPGQGSNIVFWGHVLRFRNAPDIPAPFAQMSQVSVGDLVVVRGLHSDRHYRVTRQAQVRPDQIEFLLPTAAERVTLISCIGDDVIDNGILTKTYRLVTIAQPID